MSPQHLISTTFPEIESESLKLGLLIKNKIVFNAAMSKISMFLLYLSRRNGVIRVMAFVLPRNCYA